MSILPRACSLAAAEAMCASRKESDRMRILSTLCDAWPGGHTDEEIQNMLCLSGDTERPRRGELADKGEIVCFSPITNCPETRLTASGRKATVWFLNKETKS